jgi:hypothetical protein
MNCQLGDLAITVQAELPDNIGNIVIIVGAKGVGQWSDFIEPVFIWTVKALGSECPLFYQYDDGPITAQLTGEIPDIFLRPIRAQAIKVEQSSEETLLVQ